MEEIVSFCKRRGFVFLGSEIYGGLGGAYDFGPYGVELIKNIKNSWWNSMVYMRNDIDGLDASLITNRLMWKYSGHEDNFSDPLVVCKKCGYKMRQDKMINPNKCDKCGSNDLTEPQEYKLMMGLSIGATNNGETNAYLRPETATTTYVNFKNVLDSKNRKLPFGIAQIGKAFRNEISPRGFIFRMREFEQAEMQYFINPSDDDKYFNFWKQERLNWWINVLGINKEKLRFKPHDKLAHYAKDAVDIEYLFPDGFDEVEGIHNRQDFDLGAHSKTDSSLNIKARVKENKDSIAKFNYFDTQTSQSFVPFVIETALGIQRTFLAVLLNAYTKEKLQNGEERIVLKLKKELSPVKVAVIPLVKNNESITNKALEITSNLRKLKIGKIEFENSGNIGKNYRRHDEIGTPICITVDYETLENGTVTIRDRDTMHQTKENISNISEFIKNFYLE